MYDEDCSDKPGNHDTDDVHHLHPCPNEAEDTQAMEAVIAYWQRCRVNGPVPRRSDIDPRGIEPLLSNAFIVERIAPGLARLRVAGAHLSDLLGMEVRGMPISAFFNPDQRDALAQHLVQVFDAPAIMHLSLRSDGAYGTSALTGSMVLLPLASDLGDISRALGCLITHGDVIRAPRRFDITHHRTSAIDPALSAEVGFADTRADFAPRKTSERPYLRLVQSE
ncbi:PAS domain-containing protein [Roseovarius pelagicus]|uniref:PAS domain-containing protein n=1 Tax=Roseovarius pelagicus TaxID=2980108 RepID=A0ABY6DCJ5_9RHOB|nr:PAS domain-containing protein [Roseovarius pelagicus]UXX83589.1 PAS domain-containing protein [Roseovarius pelagicus]